MKKQFLLFVFAFLSFSLTQVKADISAYEKLDGCCKKA